MVTMISCLSLISKGEFPLSKGVELSKYQSGQDNEHGYMGEEKLSIPSKDYQSQLRLE